MTPLLRPLLPALLAALAAAPGLAQAPRTAAAPPGGADARSAVGGVLISPLVQRAAVRSAQRAELTFTLENPGTTAAVADFEILPFVVADGTYATRYGAEHPRDAAPWFAQRAGQVRLLGGQRGALRASFAVPRGAEGVFWCMLKFTPRPEGSTTKSLVVYEIPIVLVAGPNPRPVVEVATPRLEAVNAQSRASGLVAVLPVANAGEGFTTIGASGQLLDADTRRTVAQLKLEDRNLLPGTRRDLQFLVPRLADGRYLLRFQAQAGNRRLPAVEGRVDVVRGVPRAEGAALVRRSTPVALVPGSLNLAIPAGGKRTSTVRVINQGPAPMALELEVKPVVQAAGGGVGLGDGPLPAGLSVQVAGLPSTLAPGASALVRVEVGVASGAAGDLWFGLSARDRSRADALPESFFGNVTVPRTERPQLVLEGAALVSDRGRPVAVKYRIRNAGNVALRPEAAASVLEGGVRLTDRLAVPALGDGGILPGVVLENVVMLPATLKVGEHVVELAYQYGPSDFARLRVPVRAASPRPAAPSPARPNPIPAPLRRR